MNQSDTYESFEKESRVENLICKKSIRKSGQKKKKKSRQPYAGIVYLNSLKYIQITHGVI